MLLTVFDSHSTINDSTTSPRELTIKGSNSIAIDSKTLRELTKTPRPLWACS